MDESCFVVSTILAIGLVVGKGALYGPETCKKSDSVCLNMFSSFFMSQSVTFTFTFHNFCLFEEFFFENSEMKIVHNPVKNYWRFKITMFLTCDNSGI